MSAQKVRLHPDALNEKIFTKQEQSNKGLSALRLRNYQEQTMQSNEKFQSKITQDQIFLLPCLIPARLNMLVQIISVEVCYCIYTRPHMRKSI